MNSAKLILVFLLLIILPVSVNSQWVSGPSTNLAICTADQTQRETRVCNDGSGNTVILWRDYRNEATIFGGDLYAQKLDIAGTSLWSNNGNSIISEFGGQFDPKFINDDNNGFYLVWRTSPNSFQNYSLHAQRIDNDGNKLWGSSNVTVQSGMGTTLNPSLMINEDGDLLIIWQLGLTGTPNSMDIYTQKINSNGIVQWGSNGLAVCLTSAISILGPKVISDQRGGAYVCWSDNRNGTSNFDIYAQKISNNGTPLWSGNGIPICTKTGNQGTKHIFSDNNGGAILFWEDIQETTYSIYGQKIDSTGNALWEPDGRLLYSTTTPFSQYEFVLDRNKEIFFLWSTSEGNIYAQKVDYHGNLLWSNSIPICTTQSSVSSLAIYKSDVNGVVIAWLDDRNVNYDLFSQWISADGMTMWSNNGVAICNENHEQSDYFITSDNFGGVVVTWADMRNGNFDVYAQNVDLRGELGTNRYQFQKIGLNKTISNLNPSSDTLSISLLPLEETGYYAVAVILDSIIHPAVNELTIKLTHLTKTDTLVCNLSSGQNFINTVLDDYALNIINSAIPPFNGLYKPYNPLSPFLGSDLNGEWVLTIEDNNGANNGLLKSWGLVFNKGELTSVDNQIVNSTPDNFILYQNYPNPFNPSTTISWQSPVGSCQTIKLFDVLGREIETIVEGYFDAGLHSSSFIVNSSLPSGVYFYQLKAGEYVNTKKMILIK
jgi:subtilisin-like proprotein convertase family protein